MTQENEKHGGVHHTFDKVQDAVGGMAGRASAGVPKSNDGFVENAAIGDLYEIASAELALERATTEEVRTFAARMIDDHMTSAHQLSAALEMNETRGVAPPPKEMDARRRKMFEHLEKAPTEKLEAMYLDQQVLAHEETFTLLDTYCRTGDNPQLRSFALGAAPVVARHLEHAKALKAQGAVGRSA